MQYLALIMVSKISKNIHLNSMKIKKIVNFAVISACAATILTSCTTTKQTVYFQGDTASYISLKPINPKSVRVQPEDILGITVSSLSEEANKMFELPVSVGLHYTIYPGSVGGGTGLQPLGYQVDSLGLIEIPLIGRVKISNLTTSEVADTLRRKLNLYLKEPTVNVRILNHKFTILGEITRPATYNILDNRTSLPEAIGMAGDLTIFGRRENIMIIRQENNKREQIRVNLLSRDILNSPYYYVRNGDIIYIEPSRVKATYNDRTFQLLPIVTSIVGAVVAVSALIINLSR